MKKILVIAVLFIIGCENRLPPTKKPFIIINKEYRNRGLDSYRFVDQDGRVSDWFQDSSEKYSIGDTIK